MDARKQVISQNIGVERFTNISTCIISDDKDSSSPIDSFYKETKSIITSIETDKLDSDDWFGAILLVAIMSNTENYFREIFSRIINICPVSQKHSANNTVNFGSVLWHPITDVERGAFEGTSFASSAELCKSCNKFLGIDLKSIGSEVLKEYQKVCELRHGIVHSGRTLAGKNGIKLMLSPCDGISKIKINYLNLQEVIAVCTALIISSNQVLFNELCKRWATTWRDKDVWTTGDELKFKCIWELFYSKIDADNNTIQNPMSWVVFRNIIRREYNI